MNERIEKVKNEIESFLKDSIDHQDKHIDYILVDPNTNETYVLASDGNDEAIEFNPLSKNYEGDIPMFQNGIITLIIIFITI